MRSIKSGGVLLLVIISACGRDEGPNPRGSEAVAASPEAAAVQTSKGCPGADFASFFAAFAEDPRLQQAWTRFPLEDAYLVVDAEPEPRLEIDSLSESEATFPLVPDDSERAIHSREVTITELEEGRQKVTIAQPDTDWVIDFVFAPEDGCWQLVRMEDHSL